MALYDEVRFMKKRVLVVDDEEQMQRTLRRNLAAREYEVMVASDGEEALDQAAEREPDVVLLDLVMPGMDGLEFTRRFREWSKAPIIVLSAIGEERAKVQALDLGADDYVTKPFGLEELLARIRSALRRSGLAANEAHSGATFETGDLRIDLHRRSSRFAARRSAHPHRYEAAEFMVTNANRVLTHNMLLKAVWGNRHGAGQTARLREPASPETSR